MSILLDSTGGATSGTEMSRSGIAKVFIQNMSISVK